MFLQKNKQTKKKSLKHLFNLQDNVFFLYLLGVVQFRFQFQVLNKVNRVIDI